jgi:poly(hydroxyalkanoate) granule-associated protein
MADEVTEVKQVAAGRFAETMRKVLLAGIGAMALAQDEVAELVARLVERGELAEADGRKVVKEALERRKALFEEKTQRAERALDRRLETVLRRMNLATREEVAALNERIAELTRKVEELTKSA